MNTSIMRLLIYLSFILVTGCSGSDPSGTNSPSDSTGNSVVFNPTSGEIPLPNVLATAMAKSPLTSSMSASDPVVRPANSPMTPPEALSYINYYEVSSTSAVSGVNAPIYIRFSSPVDATTVTADNIKVFQISADTTSTSATENNPLGFTDVTGMFKLTYSAGSTDLFLFPNFPMSSATRYLYVVSNRVKDAATGKPVVSSTYFEILKSTFPLVGAFAALEPIRANAMSGTNIKLSGYAKVMDDLITDAKVANRSEIAVMGRFITTGAGFVSKDAIGTMIPVESALRAFSAGATLGGLTGKTWTNAVTVTTPAGLTPTAYWTAAGAGAAPDSVGSIVTGTINSAQLSIDPVIAKANASVAGGDLTGLTGAYNPAAGVLQPFRDAATRDLTAYYHTTTAIPFVLITPTTPSGKVIIFQHGITGQKEQVVAVAGSLTAAGYTVVAIDLPLHGALAVPTHTTGAVWGQDFMAVGAPLATRSNIQQAAFNLNRLELTMKTGGLIGIGGITAPPTEIKYVSLSLGSIVGAYYLAGNTTLSTTGYPYTQTTLNSDMKGFLSVPGGRLAYLLQNSPAFGPSINAGLAAVGIAAGTPTYHNFMQVTQSVVDSVDPATMTTPFVAGLPSRLSGRIAIQEAVGDLVIPNDNTRYFGNALGGREVLGSAGNLVAPGFKQLSYIVDLRIPSSFMYTLTGGVPAPKTVSAATNSTGATTPAEGYFQFDQAGINHGFLLDPTASLSNTQYAQSQMVQFLLYGGIVDPTATGVAKQVSAAPLTGVNYDVSLPPVLKIFGY
ncbi:MAG: hypothetical protein J0665_15320 [Deltaproteobacteria bacterium]|nr:hypothetical protein [Deltaproteobacteria bacterium]